MDLGLRDKRAIVTGGSRGIGRRIVELLVAEGCDVATCARDRANVEETVSRLEESGRRVLGGAIDVGDSRALRSWMAEAAHALGGVDVLVLNASAMANGSDEDAWRRGLEVDVLGAVRTVEAALPFLEESRAASIIGIASTAAVSVSGGVRAYAGHKAMMIVYMKSLSVAYASRGIRANTVSPGAILFEGGVWDKRRREQPDLYAAAVKHAPCGRLGTPDEVGNAVVFLASPAASYISGANLIVDGATTSRVQF